MKAILDAERKRQVEAIVTSQHIEQEEGRANVTRIQNTVSICQLFVYLFANDHVGLFTFNRCTRRRSA